MDAETKKAAVFKLSKTKKLVGATDMAYDITLLDQRYKDLQFASSDTLRQMNKKITVFAAQYLMRLLNTPEKYTETEGLRASTVNAFNMPNENTISKHLEFGN
jgi:predicted metalloendopeptidase